MVMPGWPPGNPFPESQRESLGQGAGPDFPGSSGGREQGKFRPSDTPLLTTVAVVDDHGKPLAASTEVVLNELLWHQQQAAQWLEIIADGLKIASVAPGVEVRTPVRPFTTGPVQVPGIGTGAAYATGDQFGQLFFFDLPSETGTINAVTFYDKDDEGLPKELVFFREIVTLAADNAAFSIADYDADAVIPGGWVSITAVDFLDMGASRVGVVRRLGLNFVLPGRRVYCAIKTGGADNIAAGSVPQIALSGVY